MKVTKNRFNRLLRLMGVCMKPVEFLDSKTVLPCTEISDAVRLCHAPFISVHLLTYNQELWIAQAIESVVQQKCDWPFELIIGEDCSTDKTRQICLDYQQKYPHIIRVLLSDTNVGGRINSFRVLQRARGQYVALLEGDDYWIDEHKLQKQYGLMQKYPSALISMANTRVSNAKNQFETKDGFVYQAFTTNEVLNFSTFQRHYLHTSTYFISQKGVDLLLEIMQSYKVYDSILSFYFSFCAPVPYLNQVVSVYRVTDQGIFTGVTQENRIKQEIYVDLVLLKLTTLAYFGQRFTEHVTKLMLFQKKNSFEKIWKAMCLLCNWPGPMTIRMLLDLVRGLFCPWLTRTRFRVLGKMNGK